MSKQTEVITIDGMNCQHCVQAVEHALEGTENVQVEDVSIGSAVVTYKSGASVRDAIRAAIEEAGFSLREMNAPGDAA